MKRDYYREEMRYLHERGKAFATAYPELGRMLDIDSVSDRDPYVERLFEGFAFLTARIHERIDDELPDYTNSLMAMLWPHLLRPIPSLAILEFDPVPRGIQLRTEIPRGTYVDSIEVGELREQCRFATTQRVDLYPFRLQSLNLEWPRRECSVLRLGFQLDAGVELSQIGLESLRLFVQAEMGRATELYRFLTQQVDRVSFRAGSGDEQVLGGQELVQPVGLPGASTSVDAEETGLLDHSLQVHPGVRLLQEYLCYRRKFLFVDVGTLAIPEVQSGTKRFEVSLTFNRAYPDHPKLTRDELKLYCTPVVNLFEHQGDPIELDHAVWDYRVRPNSDTRSSLSVYEVTSVVGIDRASNRRREYRPLVELSPESEPTYSVVRRHSSLGWDTLLRVEPSQGGRAQRGKEFLSLDLRCTNGSLPHEALSEGSICRPVAGWLRQAAFRNLTRPTPQWEPPVHRHRNLFWKLIAHMSHDHRSLVDHANLVRTLSIYDWTDGAEHRGNQKRYRAIEKVTWTGVDGFRGRTPVRGSGVEIAVNEDGFDGLGELHLFGTVLSYFLAAYATINSFVQLKMERTQAGDSLGWPARSGQGALL